MTQQSRILLAVVAAVAAAAAFFFLVLSPEREKVAALDKKVATAKTELASNQQLVQDYKAAKTGYRTAYASVVRLGKAVPADDDVRSLVVQLDGAAERSKVNFQSIAVGSGGAAQTASAPAAGGSTAALPPGATVGAAGFPVMPFTFTFDGSFFRLSDFFRRLEDFVSVSNQKVNVTGRLLTLDSLSLQPTDYPNITAQVGATSFLVPAMEGLTGGATPQGPNPAVGYPASGAAKAAETAASTTATSTGAVR